MRLLTKQICYNDSIVKKKQSYVTEDDILIWIAFHRNLSKEQIDVTILL